ncbi:MAG: hypothetical protein EA341_10155 [Mongoliibacter sp.]|nr:MAG: hypothetical protein EA341_10155 [Mongoliibacter sp.]
MEDIRKRIESKIQRIVFTHQKLPFERLSKGRRLKELVIITIKTLDDGGENAVNKYIIELKKTKIQIKI